MTSDDWFDDVVGHMKEAAGLPADQGTWPTPLSEEAELEDAPEPPRVPGPTTSERLLPFGSAVRIKGGTDEVLSPVEGPSFTASGSVVLADPVALAYEDPVVSVELANELVHTTVGFVDGPGTLKPRGAVAVAGETGRVARWEQLEARLSIDRGCGAFVGSGGVAALREQGWSLVQQVWAERLVPVVHEGAVVGVAFHAGYGSGGYPADVGLDESGEQVALAVDLGVLAP